MGKLWVVSGSRQQNRPGQGPWPIDFFLMTCPPTLLCVFVRSSSFIFLGHRRRIMFPPAPPHAGSHPICILAANLQLGRRPSKFFKDIFSSSHKIDSHFYLGSHPKQKLCSPGRGGQQKNTFFSTFLPDHGIPHLLFFPPTKSLKYYQTHRGEGEEWVWSITKLLMFFFNPSLIKIGLPQQ